MFRKKEIQLNSRQQHILLLLLQSSTPVTLKEISDELEISSRTIQRELSGIDQFLESYRIVLNKKTRVGLFLEGEEEDKKKLFQFLTINQSIKIFSPEERQYLLKQLLLALKEPTKLYYFSHKFNVTEATVSNDLLKIEPWFEKHQIKLIRKPGFGVYIEGSEKSIREAIIELLYQHYSQEQLMEILSSYSQSSSDKMKLELSIKNRLLHFIDPATIQRIEEVVQKTQEWGYMLTDSAYVGLVVHIALAIQRLKNGERITIGQDILDKLKEAKEFQFAGQMAADLSSLLEIQIPESEVGYITMHLLGAKVKRLYSSSLYPNDIEDYVYHMVQIVENEMKLNFTADASLIEHLSTHLRSAIHRIKLNMEIRNPLLGSIKENYSKIFSAARKATAYLEKHLQCSIPEEEVGYIAMHFGAAAVRAEGQKRESYRTLLVCTSGMGTSRLLSAQIEKQLPHVEVVDIVSLLHLDEWIRSKSPVDLIISTVPFESEGKKAVVVNPFLLPQDIQIIESHLKQIKELKKDEPEIEEKGLEIEDTVQKVNRYGEAMVQLLSHTFILPSVHAASKDAVIKKVAEFAKSQFGEGDTGTLEAELREREERGAWVIEEDHLAMLHIRSHAIDRMCICLLRLTHTVDWEDDVHIRTVLVLLAPKDSPREHVEMIGKVGAALVEDDFVQAITSGDMEEARNQMKSVLKKGYLEKTNALLQVKS